MNEFIAYCGIDCEKCESRIATLNNDDELRKKVAEKWSKLNNVEIKPEWINCTGCKIEGVKTVFCDKMCEIRKCCIEKKFETCAGCAGHESCEKLAMITGHNEEAKNMIEKIAEGRA